LLALNVLKNKLQLVRIVKNSNMSFVFQTTEPWRLKVTSTAIALLPNDNRLWSTEQESTLISALEASVDTTVDVATPLVAISGQAVVNTYITSGATTCSDTTQIACTRVLPASVVPNGMACARECIDGLASASKKAAAPAIANCARNACEATKSGCHRVIDASVKYVNTAPK